MFDVTPMANDKLVNYLKENKISSAIRVSVMHGGCSGPALGLSLDEAKPQDESFQIDDLTFVIEKSLLEQCGSISIEYIEAGSRSGFTISSANPLPMGGGGCSSGSCGSGGCCS
ncbi:MAG: IscA/HesB family protein [Desulfofustis sp.]|nr:IscA/HesB family protein [Desulfofustis sp.]